MRRTAVNTLDWWTAKAAKRVGFSVGGPQDAGWRTAHWRLNWITAAESLVRLKQHVLVCWDWLRAFGLRDVCLNRLNSHPKSLFKPQPCFAESDRHDKYTAAPRLACKVKQTAGDVSLFNVFQFEFENACIRAQVNMLGGIFEALCNSVNLLQTIILLLSPHTYLQQLSVWENYQKQTYKQRAFNRESKASYIPIKKANSTLISHLSLHLCCPQKTDDWRRAGMSSCMLKWMQMWPSEEAANCAPALTIFLIRNDHVSS